MKKIEAGEITFLLEFAATYFVTDVCIEVFFFCKFLKADTCEEI